ncbi:MAG: DUF5103 domain-containing protein [Microscillaceae bacterium]|nr:DUF5103 domain-containing protein [Microscillaceae bacterium]MDW8460808.1 DUF5103 domain-containing protein [Cytophagales bacterium]
MISLWAGCVPFPTQTVEETQKIAQKKMQMDNHVYEDSIYTVLLQYDLPDKKTHLQVDAVPLSQTIPLVLRFDEIGNKQQNYYARIIHCTAEWQPSTLNEFEYLNDFNDFLPQEVQLSLNTKVPYIHYKFVIPKLKISGNYLIAIYRNGNPQDLILTKRLIVYENQLNIESTVRFSSGIEERKTHQQIDFRIDYKNYPPNTLIDARNDFKIVIRQNMRWDKVIQNLKPFQANDFDKVLDFNLLDLSNNFLGLNEYRRFEMQSIRFLGFNLAQINLLGEIGEARVNPDDIRKGMAYVQYPDFNGYFIVNNFEMNAGNREADYMNVIFTLKAPQELEGQVYVMGAFNQWKATAKNKMHYNPTKKAYVAQIWLKQGIYDYSYGLKRADSNIVDEAEIEGSHQATENQYEIWVYHKPVGGRSDLIVGYKAFSSRQNN